MSIHQVSALPDLSDKSALSFDIETTRQNGKDSDPYQDRIAAVAVSDGTDVWVLRDNYVSLIPMLTNPNIKRLAHNASFDTKFLKHHLGGVEIDNLYDTLLCERLLTSGKEGVGNGLDDVLARRCGVMTDKSIRDQFTGHRGPLTEQQLDYIAKDVLYLPEIRRQQLEEISKAGMGKVLALENAVVPVVAQMELDGIGFNRDLWNGHLAWLENRKQQIKQDVASYLDIPSQVSFFGGIEIGVNLNSSEQVKDILNDLDVPLDSTRELYLQEALETVENATAKRFISDVLLWRGYEKLIGYDYPSHINSITGRIHPNWNSLAAQTGRFSCSKPNMQQVRRPVEGEPDFRALFIPNDNEFLVIADYSQQEPRVLAQIVGDQEMIKAANETDMYTAMGRPIYGREITKKSPERTQLKVAVLAYYYGAGAPKIAYILGISLEEAERFVSLLNKAFPKALENGKRRVQFVAQHGFMTSLLGRRCWLLGAVGAPSEEMWRYRNQALNGSVQMSSADITKEAMCLFYRWTKENNYNRVNIRLQVHDEIVVSCPKEQAEEVQFNLVGSMEAAMEKLCPQIKAEVESHISDRWGK